MPIIYWGIHKAMGEHEQAIDAFTKVFRPGCDNIR